MKILDFPIHNWLDKSGLQQGYKVRITYRLEANLAVNSQIWFDLAVDQINHVGAKYLMDRYRILFGTAQPTSLLAWEIFVGGGVLQTDPAEDVLITGAGWAGPTRIHGLFSELVFDMKMTSKINIQNQTLGGKDSKATLLVGDLALLAAREQTTNIQQNALVGKLYSNQGKGNCWRNGFLEKNRRIFGWVQTSGHANNAASFIADPHTGHIAASAKAYLQKSFYKPPFNYEFDGKVRSKKVYLQPGGTTQSKLSFGLRMGIICWHEKYAQELSHKFEGNPTDYKLLPIGNAQMFGLEKENDSRGGLAKIEVHYQVDQVYMGKITKKRPFKTMPMTTMSAVAS
jgi:hypothetical protein